ncbi:LysE family translocator [Balneatrix alpica]|uniref:LysE family translocator n=1 Tax=Balneatrix alpica TaxID=75684 RepID=A0ABV5ZBS8_9GAMM|nr:LysE family translocator [Balneatrix alpica]
MNLPSLEVWLPILTFAFVTAGTPGPNNLLLTASGARFGLARSWPHIVGIMLGVVVMVALSGMGLAQVFIRWPLVQWLLKGIGCGYLLWLAWKLLKAKNGEQALPLLDRPWRVHEALLFQGVNPKAWMMATSAISLFVPDPSQTLEITVVICLSFIMVNMITGSSWVLLGQSLRIWLQSPTNERWFNGGLAASLVGCVLWLLV